MRFLYRGFAGKNRQKVSCSFDHFLTAPGKYLDEESPPLGTIHLAGASKCSNILLSIPGLPAGLDLHCLDALHLKNRVPYRVNKIEERRETLSP